MNYPMRAIGLMLLAITIIPTIIFDILFSISITGRDALLRVNTWIGKTFAK